MIFPGLPSLWVPLDVSNLAEDWPRWKQSFEILIVAACNNELEDRQKLAIFMHCLGKGRKLVNHWFPDLMNFNGVAAKEISFALVWNRMNAHCTTLPITDKPTVEKKKLVDPPPLAVAPEFVMAEAAVVEDEE